MSDFLGAIVLTILLLCIIQYINIENVEDDIERLSAYDGYRITNLKEENIFLPNIITLRKGDSTVTLYADDIVIEEIKIGQVIK